MNFKRRLFRFIDRWKSLPKKLDQIQESLGRIENRQVENLLACQIAKSEFKIYSQWGEDGIIQHLLRHIPIENKIFIEFGVENYLEANTRFLLVNNNWTGLVIDGSYDNIEYIKNDLHVFYEHDLKAENIFINVDNINEVITRNGINGDIGILSIDIDGNDYWIWEAITCINPSIVICEYNSIFGPSAEVSIPYNSNFYRGDAHFSKIYYGASINALNELSKKKGYSLVGSNSIGNNAFFVRNDLIGNLKVLSAQEAYMVAQFRECHDIDGKLTFENNKERLLKIMNLEVYNFKTQKNMFIKDINDIF